MPFFGTVEILMSDAFSRYHPLVNFLYFVLVLAFSMVFMHPVCLSVSLLCAITYSVYLNRRKAVRFNLRYMLPILILTALINPLFNHAGLTIIGYFRNGNPLTLESILYGVAAAVMLVTVIGWFSCFNVVISSDKFVYLFGRLIPALSLILAMALRLVPHFKAQAKVISNAQRCIGRDIRSGNIFTRVRNGIKILSILVTWALENAVDTADSMRSRGYGIPGRTAFSIYRLDRRDAGLILFMLLCGAYIVTGAAVGGLTFRYFPMVAGASFGPYAYSLFFIYFVLCITPVVINIRESRQWKVI